MATCPFCGGFRDDVKECACWRRYLDDLHAHYIPPGLSEGAFSYDVWRKIQGIERAMQLHPDLDEAWGQEKLKLIVEESEASYRTSQMIIQATELEAQKLKNNPRPKLY